MLVRKIEFYPSFNIQDSVANVSAYKVMAAEQHPIEVPELQTIIKKKPLT